MENQQKITKELQIPQDTECSYADKVGTFEKKILQANETPSVVKGLCVLFIFLLGLSVGYYVFRDTTETSKPQFAPTKLSDEARKELATEYSEKIKASSPVSQTTKAQPKREIIGVWKDTDDSFYMLYEENGKTYLNFSDFILVECKLHTIQGNEYTFHDDKNGNFTFKKGTKIYVGEGFEECIDRKGNSYKSTIILLKNANSLNVYSNDYDRNIYYELCTAQKVRLN